MSDQMLLDFTPPPPAGTVHLGPITDDDGSGCDCCAQRLRCCVCGERFLARLYGYYYMYDQRDEDGYTVAKNGVYEPLPGPCCFEAVTGRPLEDGQFVTGAWGCLTSRLWVPDVWPTGVSPWHQRIEELNAGSLKRRRKTTCQHT